MEILANRPIWRWLAAAVTGAALNSVQGLHPWWPIAWLAPIPLLIAVLSASSRKEIFGIVLLASLLGQCSTAAYYIAAASAGNLPAGVTALIAAFFTLPRVIPLLALVVIWRLIVGDAVRWYSTLLFSIAAAAMDVFFSGISSNGTFASWANSQVDALAVIQAAALGGTPAIVFLITLPASAIAIAVVRRGNLDMPLMAYGLPALILSAVLSFGVQRVREPYNPARLRVGLVAVDRADMQPSDAGGADDPTLTAYLDAAAGLAAKGAQLVVLPEKIEALADTAAACARTRFSDWARDHREPLLVGVWVMMAEHSENRAWLFGRDGALEVNYAKHHLVPLVETRVGRFRPGARYAMYSLNAHRLGVAICKDMDFPALTRVYGRAGAEALLVPAWDFDIDGQFHARMAVLRGVEEGVGVIRAARHGMLTVSDPFGRIVAEESSASARVATRAVAAPLDGCGTLYERTGDVLGWVCVAIVGLLGLSKIRTATKARG